MTDPFTSPKLRLDRAKQHILDLKQRFQAFFVAKPYAKVIEPDSTRTKYLHKIKLTKPFPDDFALMVADAAENLRAVLDQIGYVVAIAYRGRSLSKGTYFPFGGNLNDLDANIKDACKNIPDDIVTLFRSFKPYKGGDDFLWALNRICNTNKHKLLVPVGMIYGNVGVEPLTDNRRLEIPVPRWDGSKQEVIFLIADSEKEVKYKLQFTLDVAFDEIEIVGGKPVLPVLHYLSGIVERILLATEAEARRIGLIS